MEKRAMSANEIATVSRQFHERVAAILSSEELARYEAYQQRLREANKRHDTEPVLPTPEEQAVLDAINADMRAAALQKELRVLMRIETLPQ
jgi:hypothetical protein